MIEPDKHEIQCNTAEEFIDTLRPFNKNWLIDEKHWDSPYLFRGQSDARWELVPSVWRAAQSQPELLIKAERAFSSNVEDSAVDILREQLGKGLENNGFGDQLFKQRSVELFLLYQFFRTADQIGYQLPTPYNCSEMSKALASILFDIEDVGTWDKKNALNVVALAQHHGLPTRLLDWTRNPLMAAFFAAYKAKREHERIAVWALHEFAMNKVEIFSVPRHISPYITAQEGMFTYYPGADSFFLEHGRWPSTEDYFVDANIGYLHKITLPTDEVAQLLLMLWHERITTAHLMPTLDNVVSSLALRFEWSSEGPPTEWLA